MIRKRARQCLRQGRYRVVQDVVKMSGKIGDSCCLKTELCDVECVLIGEAEGFGRWRERIRLGS